MAVGLAVQDTKVWADTWGWSVMAMLQHDDVLNVLVYCSQIVESSMNRVAGGRDWRPIKSWLLENNKPIKKQNHVVIY